MGIINYDYLNDVTGGDQDILKKVLAAYITHLPADLVELKRLVDIGDYANAGLMAHKVKSSARILGIESALWLAEIEKAAKTNTDTHIIQQRLIDSERNLQEALVEIQHILNN
jgi:HPt (histidine-containing phosphotransfer) domain-containing protein